MNESDAKKLINLARDAIFDSVKEVSGFEERKGVFVTLNSYPSKKLRGCVGFIEPVYILKEAVVKAARAAAFEDSRFEPLDLNEKVTIELSILSEPKPLKSFDDIVIGRDGLIVNDLGLLLPQVAVEYGWNKEEFVEQTCVKAGLDPKGKDKYEWFKFESEIFYEKVPNGEVVRKVFKASN